MLPVHPKIDEKYILLLMGQQCMLNQNEHVHVHHMWCVTQTAVILLPGRYFSFDSISVCYVGKISLIPLDVKTLTYSPSQASLVIRGINTYWDEQIHRMRGSQCQMQVMRGETDIESGWTLSLASMKPGELSSRVPSVLLHWLKEWRRLLE